MCERKPEQDPQPTPAEPTPEQIATLIAISRGAIAAMVVEVMHEVMQAILIDDRDERLRAVATIMRQQLELEQRHRPVNWA